MPSGVYKHSKGVWKPTQEQRKKMSIAQIGNKKGLDRIFSSETKKKISLALKGHDMSNETRRKISNSLKGEKNKKWRGGISTENNRIRTSIEFRLWREAVFARDNWTCQKTGIKGGELQPHHIKNFTDNKELRFAIDNGVTLSLKSHRDFHKKYGCKNNTREQLEEFLSIKQLK